MPIKRFNTRVFKEIKVYTLRRLLKRRMKYENTPNEAEDYRRIEGIYISKNLNPFKLLDRGIITSADIQEAVNELEGADLIEIENNKLKLTLAGVDIAKKILNISSLSQIDDDIFGKPQPIEKEKVSTPAGYQCPNCGNEISDPKKFCPNCGTEIAPQNKTRCPNCGTYNEPASAFCVKCGARFNSY